MTTKASARMILQPKASSLNEDFAPKIHRGVTGAPDIKLDTRKNAHKGPKVDMRAFPKVTVIFQ